MEGILVCYECGTINPADETYCSHCGAELSGDGTLFPPHDAEDDPDGLQEGGDLFGELLARERGQSEEEHEGSGDTEEEAAARSREHRERFDFMLREACSSLERVVEQRMLRQMERMTDLLSSLEQELDRFLAQRGGKKSRSGRSQGTS